MNPILRHPLSLLFLCVAAPLTAQTTTQDAKVDLSAKLKQGSTVWLVQETRNEQAIDMGGQQMEMGNHTTYTIRAEVTKVGDDGKSTLQVKLVRVAGSMTVPMVGDVEFDSAQPAAEGDSEPAMPGMPNLDAIGKAMSAMADTTFTAVVDAHGNVSEVKGFEESLAAARKKAGRVGAQMLGGQLNEGVLSRMVETVVGVRPKEAIAVGTSWEQTDKQKQQRMEVANKMKLTLNNATAEDFVIGVEGTIEKPRIEVDKGEGEEEDEGAAMAREMMANMQVKNGKIQGSSKLSRADGFVLESRSVMSMEIHTASPMGGDMIIDNRVTTTVKRTTEAEATKKPGADKAGK
jgi:hypothetical protein